jgi:hypothetical protein
VNGFVLLVIVALLGLLLWVAAPGKAGDIGRVLFMCAFLAICFGASPSVRWLR